MESLSPDHQDSPLSKLGSPLAAFLENKFDGRSLPAVSFLRKEIQSIMGRISNTGRDPSAAAGKIAQNIDPETGNSRYQCDASEALIALMEYVGTPRILMQEVDIYHGTSAIRPSQNQRERQQGGELILSLGINQSNSIQNVISSNLTGNINGVEDSDGNRRDIN